MRSTTFALLRERKKQQDTRVVFSPAQLREAQEIYPNAKFIVESSELRVFPDVAYEKEAFTVTSDCTQADVFLGVKEIPPEALLANKTYVFFSHTIKKQSFNRQLLRTILDKNITLYDHELFKSSQGARLIGFGKFAGLAGAYNGIRALGLRNKSWVLPMLGAVSNLGELKRELDRITLPQLKICVTGKGRVAGGVREILEYLKVQEVSVERYLEEKFDAPVFCNIDMLDYAKRKDQKPASATDFYKHPELFEPDFFRFAEQTDLLITGHFFAPGAPVLFSREDAQQKSFNIQVVADISCDINGSVASTIRTSSSENPFYGYDPQTGRETTFDAPGAITVMAVDNLPCELALEASVAFGTLFLKEVLPAFFNNDADGVLERACIVKEGKLTPNFEYLQDFADGKE